MDFIDYYKTLGIDKKASPEQVKKAYRKMARKFHPDLSPDKKDAQLNFQKINEANKVLSDPESRKMYDQYGKDWQHAGDFEKAKSAQSSDRRSTRSAQNASDFFESMFGRNTGSGHQVRFSGEDYRASLEVSLVEASKTHVQTLNVNGKGIRITIPAGIEHGQTIKIKNHGSPGMNGGLNGDLFIMFSIPDHPDFKRLKNNLYVTKELDLYMAILGGELTVDTLSGKVKLKEKPETHTGEKVKLKGKGYPVYKNDGSFADLYETYQI
ncbi:MAG: DnaJ C-terminal domain-containing protein, partial [Marinoscillum sp.]